MMITITIVKPTTESPVMRARFFACLLKLIGALPCDLIQDLDVCTEITRQNLGGGQNKVKSPGDSPPKAVWKGKTTVVTTVFSARTSLAGNIVLQPKKLDAAPSIKNVPLRCVSRADRKGTSTMQLAGRWRHRNRRAPGC